MLRVSKSEVINATPEIVFESLADVRRHTRWYQSFGMRVKEATEEEPGFGQVAWLEGRYQDQPVVFQIRTTEYVPSSRIVFSQIEVYAVRDIGRARSSKTKETAYRISYDIETQGPGCKVTRCSEPEGQWWALFAYAVWPVLQPIRLMNQSKILRSIKSELEKPVPMA